MTYKAQLVVRARSKEGAAIIEKVKELASEQGSTYSEMAVELLGRGLNADDDVDGAFQVDASDGDGEKEEEEEEEEEENDDLSAVAISVEESVEVEKKKAPAHPKAPLPPEEAGPAVDPELPPEEIVKHYLQRRSDRGERAAARILVDFFAAAGPGAGGNLKKLLQKEFTEAEFDELMAPIKETEEYATYTERAIFGEPSPYSQVN